MDINMDWLQWFINVLIKKLQTEKLKNENNSNKKVAEELHKLIIRKFKNRKVHSTFIDNIWGDDFADMKLIIKLNEGCRILLRVIHIYSKFAWVILLKITITDAFQKMLDGSKLKVNKIWVGKGSKFYNTSMKSWLEKNVFNTRWRKICYCWKIY